MRKIKRVLLLAFVLSVLLGCLMFHASAAEVVASGYCGGEGDGTNLSWILGLDGTLTVTGSGKMRDYSGSPPWFNERASIKKVVIDSNVTTIGNFAFRWCDNLISVELPDGLTVIGEQAFDSCDNLYDLRIPDSVMTIDGYAFSNCVSLSAVVIPNGVEALAAGVFSNCIGLEELLIGTGVTSIDSSFSGCTSLKSVTIPDNVTRIGNFAFNGCSALESLTLGTGVETIGSYAFRNCKKLMKVTIPSGVTQIDQYAFFDCYNLEAMYFEGIAPQVGKSAFTQSTVTLYYIPEMKGWTDSTAYDADAGTWNGYKLEIWEEMAPDENIVDSGYCGGEGYGRNLTWTLDSVGTLTVTGMGAMKDFSFLSAPWSSHQNAIKQVVIANGVTTIGDYAFCDCINLAEITIPDSVITVGDWVFRYCINLTEITIPDSVTSIGEFVLANCGSLTSVALSNSVTVIGDGAFYNCKNLAVVNIPDSVTTIGESAFMYCNSLISVVLPNSVAVIGDGAFYNCKNLAVVNIPDSVTTIGDNAFMYCDSLTSVSISDSVTFIGCGAFLYCYYLNSVYFEGDAPSVDEYDPTFEVNVTLYYTPGTTGWTDSEAYDPAAGTWNGYKLEVWKEKAYVAYGYCGGEGDGTNLEWTLDKEGTLTVTGTGSMSNYAYTDMPWYGHINSIKKVVIENGVTTIGSSAFIDHYGLTSATIPASVTAIGTGAFYRDDRWDTVNPLEVYFEGNAPTIGEITEDGTYGVTKVFCPDDVLYYTPGMTGWTDSNAYNAKARTWYGYKLRVLGGTEEPAVLEATLSAIEVSMDSELLLWLKFNLPEELVNDDKAYAVVTADKKGGLKETVIPMTEIRAKGADKNGRYVIEQGMASPELGREVTVSFVDGNGNDVNINDYMDGSVNTSVTRTIVDYAKLALEKGNTKQKNLNRALLAYGGYAQTFFKVDTAAPVYNVLPAFGYEIPTFAEITADTLTQVMTNTGDAGITVNTQQAFLDSSIYHRVYFTVNRGTSIDELDFRLTKYGNPAVTTEVEPVYEADADRYYIQIDDIASPLLDYMYTITVTNGTTFEEQTVSTSVMCWLKLGLQKSNNAAQKNLFKAMYNYNQVANSFFGR